MKPPVTLFYTRRTTVSFDVPSLSDEPPPAASSSLNVLASPYESSILVYFSSFTEPFLKVA
jgi:hypothetical protein